MEGKFSKFEDAYIMENYHDNRDIDIAKRLKRSIGSVKMRRRRIGLLKIDAQSAEHLNSDYRVNLEIRALQNYSGSMTETATDRLAELLQKKTSVIPILFRQKIPLAIKAKAYELHCSGITIRKIAKDLGHNKSHVCKWINSFKPYTGKSSVMVVLKSKF